MFKIRTVDCWLILGAVLLLWQGSVLAQKPEAKKKFEEGIQYKEMGMNFQAKESFQKALKLDPQYHSARVELAGVYADLNMMEEAIAELAMLKKVTKPVPKYHTYSGLINYKIGLEIWTKLVQNHPEYMYKDDGKVRFIKKGEPEEVQIDKLAKKVERDTTQWEARYQLRGMYYDLAADELLKAVKENSKDTLANLTLGLVYLEKGKKDLALKQQEVLAKLDKKAGEDLKFMIEYVEQGKKELEETLKKDKM